MAFVFGLQTLSSKDYFSKIYQFNECCDLTKDTYTNLCHIFSFLFCHDAQICILHIWRRYGHPKLKFFIVQASSCDFLNPTSVRQTFILNIMTAMRILEKNFQLCQSIRIYVLNFKFLGQQLQLTCYFLKKDTKVSKNFEFSNLKFQVEKGCHSKSSKFFN